VRLGPFEDMNSASECAQAAPEHIDDLFAGGEMSRRPRGQQYRGQVTNAFLNGSRLGVSSIDDQRKGYVRRNIPDSAEDVRDGLDREQ
jgi:hypothetical protein